MVPTKNSRHNLEESCFFKLPNKRKLAKLLFTNVRRLELLANSDDAYRCWEEPKKNGGVRNIEAPHEGLKTIQRRIANLLQRVEPPGYLMAPVKKRSYINNAGSHRGSRSFRLLDIEDYFPSCSYKKVYWFFHNRMQCAPDVAAILTKIATFRGHLPQGSPCSPILAYFSYIEMWDEINSVVSSAGCQLTIYADDITISGDTVREKDVWLVKQALHRHGHSYSRSKERSIVSKPANITGVIVRGHDLLLPNRQHKKLREARESRRVTKNDDLRQSLDSTIRGRIAQASQILRHND